MSIKLMAAIWDHGPADQVDRFVLLALADSASDAGKCWPSMETLARKVCMSRKGVQNVVNRLEAAGWIVVKRGGGRRKSNQYHVNSEPDTQNAVRSLGKKLRTTGKETANVVPENSVPRSHEPLRTIKEPSRARAREEGNPTDPPANRGRSDCEGERPAEIDEYLRKAAARGGGRKVHRKGTWP